jgi:hypothetical protein
MADQSTQVSELDTICREAFVGLYGRAPDSSFVPMDDAYNVLGDDLKGQIKDLILTLLQESRGKAELRKKIENL